MKPRLRSHCLTKRTTPEVEDNKGRNSIVLEDRFSANQKTVMRTRASINKLSLKRPVHSDIPKYYPSKDTKTVFFGENAKLFDKIN